MKLLVEHGADVNKPVRNGFTPLHLTAKRNNLACAEILAENGATIDAESRNGYTPLHLAAQDGQIDFVDTLINKYKANPACAAQVSFWHHHVRSRAPNRDFLTRLVKVLEYELNLVKLLKEPYIPTRVQISIRGNCRFQTRGIMFSLRSSVFVLTTLKFDVLITIHRHCKTKECKFHCYCPRPKIDIKRESELGVKTPKRLRYLKVFEFTSQKHWVLYH